MVGGWGGGVGFVMAWLAKCSVLGRIGLHWMDWIGLLWIGLHGIDTRPINDMRHYTFNVGL